MKIAILIAGYLRGFQENINKIKEHVIQGNECDIYMHITDDYSHDKYNNKNVNIEKIKNDINPKVLIVSKNLNFVSNKNVNNLLNQNYKYFWLNQERNKIMKIENINYDVVFKIRPDTHFLNKINLTFDHSFIQIPIDSKMDATKLQDFDNKYICDIFAYGSSELMNQYFNFYNNMETLIDKYGIIGETLLYHYLTNNNIPYELVNVDYMIVLSLCNTVAITGDSGSGKTTISKLLKEMFKNGFILECDRYHKWERKHPNWNKYTHLNPESNYLCKMEKDVFDLKIGNNVYQIDYDHKTGNFTDKQLINSSDNIIVCGLHTLYLQDTIVNLKIYMDTDDNLKIPWKISRDIKHRGYSIQNIIKQIENRKEDFIKYIQPQRENADIIISYYTDKPFDTNTFIVDEKFNIYLKIGIKKYIACYDNFPTIKKEYDNGFIFLYFAKMNNYDDIIKQFIQYFYANNLM